MQLLDETESHRNYSLPGWTFGLLALLVISLILLLLPTIPHHLDLTRFAPSRSEAMSAIVEKNEYCTPDDILRSVKLDRIVDSFDYTLSHEEAAESLVLDSTGPCELRIISASDAIHLVSFLVRITPSYSVAELMTGVDRCTGGPEVIERVGDGLGRSADCEVG